MSKQLSLMDNQEWQKVEDFFDTALEKDRMKRLLAALLCAFSLSAYSAVPSQAEETTVSAAEPSTTLSTDNADKRDVAERSDKSEKSEKSDKSDKEATPPSGDSGIKGRLGGFLSKIPTNVPALVVGWVVGTPVALTRMSKREIITATRELVGDTDNPLILGAAGILGVPAGLMSGGIYGLWAGAADSWVNADDNPYSRDAFSLGEMK